MVHEQIDAAVSLSSTSGDGGISSTLDTSNDNGLSVIKVGYTIEWRHLLRALGESVFCKLWYHELTLICVYSWLIVLYLLNSDVRPSLVFTILDAYTYSFLYHSIYTTWCHDSAFVGVCQGSSKIRVHKCSFSGSAHSRVCPNSRSWPSQHSSWYADSAGLMHPSRWFIWIKVRYVPILWYKTWYTDLFLIWYIYILVA